MQLLHCSALFAIELSVHARPRHTSLSKVYCALPKCLSHPVFVWSLQEQLLKLVPQQQQIQYYGGTPVDLGVRVGTGLVLTLAASKIPLLAAGTLFYPVWWPIYKAWSQNQKLRSQYRFVPDMKVSLQHA